MPAATATPVLDQLRPEEQAVVLAEILRTHPDLRQQAGQEAMALLNRVSAEKVASRVTTQLGELELDDLAARAGRVPGGYVEPTEAAYGLVMDTLAPIEADLRRCIHLHLPSAARQTLLGLLAGLYRSRSPHDGTVLACAGPDVTVEHAAWMVEDAGRSGLELRAEELQEWCPGWQLIPASSGTTCGPTSEPMHG